MCADCQRNAAGQLLVGVCRGSLFLLRCLINHTKDRPSTLLVLPALQEHAAAPVRNAASGAQQTALLGDASESEEQEVEKVRLGALLRCELQQLLRAHCSAGPLLVLGGMDSVTTMCPSCWGVGP